MWRATALTLFPEMFPGTLGLSLAGKALERGTWALETLDIREFARDKHRSVDDTPFGGGPGMVMRADVLDAAIREALARQEAKGIKRGRLVYLSPRGRVLDQALVREIAQDGRPIAPGSHELGGTVDLDALKLAARIKGAHVQCGSHCT